MRGLLVLAGAAVLAAGARGDDKKDAKFDPEKLVGKWTMTSAERGGEKKGADELKDWSVELTKDTLTLKSGPIEFVMKYKLDASKSPAVMNLEMIKTAIGEPGAKAVALVELKGDEFKLCYLVGDKAPKGFESKKDDEARSIVMKRVKK